MSVVVQDTVIASTFAYQVTLSILCKSPGRSLCRDLVLPVRNLGPKGATIFANANIKLHCLAVARLAFERLRLVRCRAMRRAADRNIILDSLFALVQGIAVLEAWTYITAIGSEPNLGSGDDGLAIGLALEAEGAVAILGNDSLNWVNADSPFTTLPSDDTS